MDNWYAFRRMLVARLDDFLRWLARDEDREILQAQLYRRHMDAVVADTLRIGIKNMPPSTLEQELEEILDRASSNRHPIS